MDCILHTWDQQLYPAWCLFRLQNQAGSLQGSRNVCMAYNCLAATFNNWKCKYRARLWFRVYSATIQLEHICIVLGIGYTNDRNPRHLLSIFIPHSTNNRSTHPEQNGSRMGQPVDPLYVVLKCERRHLDVTGTIWPPIQCIKHQIIHYEGLANDYWALEKLAGPHCAWKTSAWQDNGKQQNCQLFVIIIVIIICFFLFSSFAVSYST